MKFIFIFLSAITLFSCGNSVKDKQKSVLYINKSREFVASEEYLKIHLSAKDSSLKKDASGKLFLDEKNYRKIFNSVLEKKFNEIASACGFRDYKEADTFVVEFKDDSEIRTVLDMYVLELKDRKEEIDKKVNLAVEMPD